jgi:hypothetical protein
MMGWLRRFLSQRVPPSRRRRAPPSRWSSLALAVTSVLLIVVADLASASTQQDWTIDGSLALNIDVHATTLQAFYTLRIPAGVPGGDGCGARP